MKLLRNYAAIAVLCSLFLTAPTLAGGKRPRPVPVDISRLDFRAGDVLLQHFASKLGSVIADVSNSQYSHCGMVLIRDNEPHVIEAIGPVRIVPVEDWIKQGQLHHFTQLRPRRLTAVQIEKAIDEAEKMLGQPYDIQYEWDDEKIYCSELIYKAFDRALGIEIGEKQKLRELKWKTHPLFITYLAGGRLPLNRVMVTPESLVRCERLKLITSNFPPRTDEPKHDNGVLAGDWSGEYTIPGRQTTLAALRFDRGGMFNRGEIRVGPKQIVRIQNFSADTFHEQREFHARLVDSRGLLTTAHLQIRDGGNRIIGTWKDDLGNVGLLSFERSQRK